MTLAILGTPQGRLTVRLNRLLETADPLRDDQTARTFITMAAALLPSDDDRSEAEVVYKPASNGLAYWQFRRVVEYVDANIDVPLRIPELAAMVRLSASQFVRCFKVSAGLTPSAYILNQRIARSKQMLSETELVIAEIALACGFADQAHFSSRFRSVVGESPNRWRKLYRADVWYPKSPLFPKPKSFASGLTDAERV